MTILGLFIPVWLLIILSTPTLAGLIVVYVLIAKYSTVLSLGLAAFLWDKDKDAFQDTKDDVRDNLAWVLTFWWGFAIIGIIAIIVWPEVKLVKLVVKLVKAYFKFLDRLIRL